MSDPRSALREIARASFVEIQTRFPELTMTDGLTDEGEPQLEISEQPGLSFDVGVSLSDDVLHLCAGRFWGEWFPATEPERVSSFVAAVVGLIAGNYRIVEHSRRGRLVRAHLQRPGDSRWETVFRDSRLALPLLPTTTRVLQNDGR